MVLSIGIVITVTCNQVTNRCVSSPLDSIVDQKESLLQVSSPISNTSFVMIIIS